MKKPILFSVFIIAMITQGRAQTLETVPEVDLEKYVGTWYEIASFPQRFQKGCHGTTATYTKTDKDYIIVDKTDVLKIVLMGKNPTSRESLY